MSNKSKSRSLIPLVKMEASDWFRAQNPALSLVEIYCWHSSKGGTFIYFWCIIGILSYQAMPIVHAMQFMGARQCQICRQCQLFKQTMPNMHAMPFSLLDNAKCACNAICVRQTMPNVHAMPFMRLRQCQICRKCQLCTQCHF